VCECLGGKPGRAMKVKVSLGKLRWEPFPLGGVHHRPIMILGERFEFEHICWDPKDGELCLNRVKPGETLVEARRDSDVQIDLQIWV
jgi:hypothetical protein